MLNSILEKRTVEGERHSITLDIHEKEYFTIYEDIGEDAAREILENYLRYRADDGRPEEIKVKHNKNEHLVSIRADLYYTDNQKTLDTYHVHDTLREKRA